MRKLKNLFALGLMLVLGVSYAEQAPVEMLQQAANQVLAVLKSHQSELKTNPQIVQNAVRQYLVPHIDVAGMSRSVLGREAWMKASAAEKSAFAQAFLKLVIRTYGSSLSKYKGETIKFYPLRDGAQGKFVRVQSEIVRPSGPALPINYSLVSKKGAWKVYDFTVEGVSLLQSYRSQFSEALQHSTLTELTKKIQQSKQVVSS